MSGVWTDHGAMPDGVVGGDGAGESISRRFSAELADGTFIIITSYYYPVNVGERFGEDREDAATFDVENATEVLICTDLDDPGGTEITANMEFDFPSLFGFLAGADASLYCQRAAVSESADLYGEPENCRQPI